MNSRDKGKRGELEASELLRRHGFEARRGQQFSGSAGSPDVVHDIPGVHLEVKRVETFQPYKALAQAIRDASGHGTKPVMERGMPVVLHRRNREDWIAVLRADDLLQLLKERQHDALPAREGSSEGSAKRTAPASGSDPGGPSGSQFDVV